jgi:hypothetical protein
MSYNEVRRFCPFCAMGNYAEDSPYTMWTTYMSGQGMCENDTGSWHKVDMSWGKYGHDIGIMQSATRELSIKRAVFTDDGIVCDGKYYYQEMFEATVGAMEAEAESGVFNVKEWENSFPRRSIELLGRMEKAVKDVLDDALPSPLIGIVTGYLW